MKKNIIIFSSIDWDTQWQWHQELAFYLSKNYNVLFVENTGVRKAKIKDTKRIISRIKNIIKYLFGFRKINENLFILSPFTIPLPYNKFFLKINFYFFFNKLQKWLSFNKFTIHSIFSFSATPVVVEVLKNLQSDNLNFLYVDLMSSSSKEASKLKSYEKIMIANSDNVFCSSNDLLKKVKKLNKNYYFFPGGVDLKKFNNPFCYNNELKKEISKIGKPIIGFLGQIRNVIDKSLIKKICYEFPNCSIVMVGPVDSDMQELKNISENIVLLGKQDHKNIPYILSKFDVGIIPYIKNSFTDSMNPAKLNEYIASNLSVVTTNLNEIKNYNRKNNNIISVSKNHEYFLKNIHLSLNKKKNNFKNIVKKYDWPNIFKKVSIQSNLNININNKKDLFFDKGDQKINLFNKFFYYSLKRFLTASVLIYLFIFYSGAPSILFNNVHYYDNLKNEKIEGFFVMTGHGDPRYYNGKYLFRFEEIKKYYHEFKPKKILIIGRWSNMQEDKVLKGLLINEGISADIVKITEKYFENTKENIVYSREYFDANSIEKVLVITDYLHSNRVKLIKEKILEKPENYLLAKNLNDKVYKKFKFKYTLNDLRVIVYENLAIIYAKIRSWI
tara:strand:- start:2337 stop:4178 length:1842 start_codon:yes stop_codon:yes gene_type:complete